LRVGLLDKFRISIGGSRDTHDTQCATKNADAPALPLPSHLSEHEILAELIRYVVGREDQDLQAKDVDPSANIFDYGYVDSLGVLAFLSFLEQQFGARISDEDLIARFTTLGALARHVAGSSSGQYPSGVDGVGLR